MVRKSVLLQHNLFHQCSLPLLEVFAGTYRGNYQIAVKTLSNMTDDRISNGRLNLLREAAVMTLVQ